MVERSLLRPLEAPDILPLRAGNTGIEYVWSFEGPRPGPHVILNALVHGNEISGAVAVLRLFERGVWPQRGRLTLCLANVAAFERFNPGRPLEARFVDEDFQSGVVGGCSGRPWTQRRAGTGPPVAADL
ncbi:hypothetical protein CCP1ISM_9600001 [Azospirillaceae bacterium]